MDAPRLCQGGEVVAAPLSRRKPLIFVKVVVGGASGATTPSSRRLSRCVCETWWLGQLKIDHGGGCQIFLLTIAKPW